RVPERPVAGARPHGVLRLRDARAGEGQAAADRVHHLQQREGAAGRLPAPLLLPLHPLPRQGNDGEDRRGALPGPEEVAAEGGDGGVLRGARGAGPEEEALDLGTARLAEAPAGGGHPSGSAAFEGPQDHHPAAARRAAEKRAGCAPVRATGVHDARQGRLSAPAGMLGRVLSDVLASLRRSARAPAATDANPLSAYFFANTGRLMHKWHHYLDIYHRHFRRFRGRSPVVLEIGVYHGGSLQMWREYFGPGTRIVGLDIDPRCAALAEDGIEILIGDQADRAFLAEVRRRHPHVDIVIDDGGHGMQQQIVSFEELYPHLQPEGIYLCEDMHTS